MENTIAEFKALTGNNLRFIRADSDSIFDTSQEMRDLYTQAKIKPTFSSPHDQSQNSIAENGIKKLNRDVRTVMKASGAPAHLWPEADDYCIHMHNHLPTQKGTKGPVSRYSIMRGGTYAHDMELFMPFGCKALVMTPVKARGGAQDSHTGSGLGRNIRWIRRNQWTWGGVPHLQPVNPQSYECLIQFRHLCGRLIPFP